MHFSLDSAKGFGGLGGMFLAQLTSFQQDLEWGLRIISLLLGLWIAFLTIRSMRKKRPEPGED